MSETLSSGPGAKISVLIADDHGLVRAGLRAILSAEPDMTVVGEAADGAEALDLAGRLQPAVVLADISMPPPDGIEVARRLRSHVGCCRTLIVSMHEDRTLLADALSAGAAGYLIKRAVESELPRAIRAVAAGQRYIHEFMQQYLEPGAAAPGGGQAAENGVQDALSATEVRMLQMLAKGATVQRIGEVLGISYEQARQMREVITQRLDLPTRVDIVRYVRQHFPE